MSDVGFGGKATRPNYKNSRKRRAREVAGDNLEKVASAFYMKKQFWRHFGDSFGDILCLPHRKK